MRTRIRLYRGVTEAQAQERFRTDAVWALQDGWYPREWRWDGIALRVVYMPTPDAPPKDRPVRGRRRWRPLSAR